jgi:RAB protein geranylgeranyltransferase component A
MLYEKTQHLPSFYPTYLLNVLLNFYHGYRYLFCCSYAHNVAPKGKYIAFVSTEAETDKPEVELKPGIDLLGPVDEIFYDTYDRFVPTNKHEVDNCYISTVSTHKIHFLCFDFP